MTDPRSLLAAVDDLYAAVVTDPGSWGDEAFVDWAGDVAAGGADKGELRALRRCLRTAQKLRDFWAEGRAEVAAADWRARIDVALGPRAWRPTLELAMAGLEASPSPELYDDVKRRFRLVNGASWMEGVDYDEWLASRAGPDGPEPARRHGGDRSTPGRPKPGGPSTPGDPLERG